MPFTAFHMGAALLGKGVAPRAQSIWFFVATQAAIDLEPAVKMAIGSDADLHQITHHPLGLAVTVTAAALAWAWAQRRSWLGYRLPVLTRRTLAWTAAWGAASHWMLDAMSHVDMGGAAVVGYYGIDAAQDLAVFWGALGLALLAIRWAARRVIAGAQARRTTLVPPAARG